MKRFFCLFVAIVMCLMSIPAFAMSLSFEEIKNIIDSTAVDDVHMFTDMQHFSDGGINSDAAYISEGIALMWYEDIQQAEVLLFSSSNPKEGYKWNLAEAGMKYIQDAVLILSVLSELNTEPVFTFIATESAHNSPLQYLAEHTLDTDSDKFAVEVATYIKNNISENVATEKVTYTVLQKGDKGESVVALQKRLNDLGYDLGTADGDFGNRTKVAVELFQKTNGISATGIADVKTQELLFSNNAKEAPISRKMNQQFAVNGLGINVTSAKFVNSYDYGSMIGNPSNGTYLCAKITLENDTGRSISSSDSKLSITAKWNGRTYYGTYFPNDKKDYGALMWGLSNNSIGSGKTLNMVYLIDMPKDAKNSGTVSLCFPDGTECVIR